MDKKKYCTTTEAADRLDVSVPTITRWIHSGILEAVRLPGKKGKWFVKRKSISELLKDFE